MRSYQKCGRLARELCIQVIRVINQVKLGHV